MYGGRPAPAILMNRSVTILAAVLAQASFLAVAAGQDPPVSPPQAVREVAPELFYLKDESGRLVPVPGFRYRDFLDLFRIKEGLGGAAAPPRAVLESVVVEIDARRVAAGDASCPVTVTAQVRQSRAGWAMVPLGLGHLFLEGPPQHDGPGRMLVDADPERGGYRCWFEPPSDAGDDLQHSVVLAGRMPVTASAAWDSFLLRLPAAVASRLEVRSARRQPRVELRPASAGRVETAAAEGGSLVTITGLSGEVSIRVEASDATAATAGAAEADCQSLVRIDGRTAVTEATVSLAGMPPGTRQLRVTLPPRARLRRVGGDAAAGAERAGGPADVAMLSVETGADGRASIELECERPIEPSGSGTVDPLGFAVAGIEPWRQRGRASLFVEGDWQATWEDVAGVRRVDPPPGERGVGFVAAFAYDAQPASLPLQIRPRLSRVVIEPEYRYDVSAVRVGLQARLRVAVRGAPIGTLSLGLDPAWIVGDVGPAGLVDSAGVRSEAGRVTIPFLQPLAGDAVVEIEAALEIDPSADRVAWRLPVPRADLVGPAAVLVASDSAIELLPDPTGTTGLVRQTSSSVDPGDADSIAAVYRLDAPEGAFAATRRFLQRRVEAVSSGRIVVDDAGIDVVQAIRLDVLHVPLEFLDLSLSGEVVDAGALEIRQGGTLIEALAIEVTGETDSAGRPLARVKAPLPQPLLGRGEVSVRYRLPMPPIPAEATAAVDVPLPLPAVSGTLRQTVSIEEPKNLTVVPRGDAWRRDVAIQPGAGRSWSATKPRDMLPLAISARSRETAGVTVIEAAWLQTRLFADTREDSFAYVISPAAAQVEVRLPAAGSATSIEARLDGAAVSLDGRGDEAYAIDMTTGQGRRLLEIRVVSAWGGNVAGLGLPWPLRLAPPAFAADVIQRRFAWEVGVIRGDHVLAAPHHWTSQQRWVWRGYGWGREPVVSSADLAAWLAETIGRPAVAGAVSPASWPLHESRAVYAGIGPPGEATAWVVPTWLLVLVASGLTLAVGLAMVSRPAWRRPVAVLALATGAIVSAAAFPNAAPLFVQAAVPGVVLATLAAMLRRLDRPASRRSPRPALASASSLTRSAAAPEPLLVASSLEATRHSPAGRDAE